MTPRGATRRPAAQRGADRGVAAQRGVVARPCGAAGRRCGAVRCGVVALLAALLVLAAPARAQDRGSGVVGGGSFNSAPVLVPGTYRDTILRGEYLYYGFRLAAGQRLRVTVDLTDAAATDLRGVVYFAANLHSPLRTTDVGSRDSADASLVSSGGLAEQTLEVTTAEASAVEDAGDRGTWSGAGVYYFAVHAVPVATDRPSRAEIPFSFTATVEGAPQPNATATPTATATPSPTASPPRRRGPSVAVAVGAGALALLAGGGFEFARRRRPYT